ncbi:MAG: hypothetical protein PVF65_05955 [Sphingomonadales bacterium]|jgi:hypothetical protein
MKTILSVAGVLALTMGAWALETEFNSSSEALDVDSLFVRISDLRQNCEIQSQEGLGTKDSSSSSTKDSVTGRKAGRDPLPAERLGLMLKLSSL